MKNKNKILVIDIETTGFLDDWGTIVEVGIVSLNLKTGNKTILLDVVTQEEHISLESVKKSWIVNNSTLSVKQILYSEKFFTVKERIQRIIKDYPEGATAFNRSFDFDFLESRGIKFVKKLPCPMLKLTSIIKLPLKYPNHGPYKWPSVEEAYNYFFPHNKYVEKHRGVDDALHEAKIVFELHRMGEFI